MIQWLAKLALPSWALYAATFAIGLAGATMVTRWYYGAQISRMEAAQSAAVAKAVSDAAVEQKRVDKVTLDFTAKESDDQQNETTKTVTITKWAIRHVKDVSNCPGPDLVRVHNAAATGADPESIVYGPTELNGPRQVP